MAIRELLGKVIAGVDLQDVFVFGGLGLVTVGAHAVYPPAGWIVPGAVLMAIGLRGGA